MNEIDESVEQAIDEMGDAASLTAKFSYVNAFNEAIFNSRIFQGYDTWPVSLNQSFLTADRVFGYIEGQPVIKRYMYYITDIPGTNYRRCLLYSGFNDGDGFVYPAYSIAVYEYDPADPNRSMSRLVSCDVHYTDYSDRVITLYDEASGQYVGQRYDEFLESLSDGANEVEAMITLIESSPITGSIPASKITGMLDRYQDSDFISDVQQRLSSCDSIDTNTILTIVTDYFNRNSSAAHEGSNQYYSPVDKPKYTDNVVATVLGVLFSIIGTVLAVCFRFIRTVLALIAYVVSSVISLLSKAAWNTTQSTIDHISDIGVLNYMTSPRTIPVGSIETEKVDIEDHLSGFGLSSNVPSLTDAVTGSSRFVPMVNRIVPKTFSDTGDITEYFFQTGIIPTSYVFNADEVFSHSMVGSVDRTEGSLITFSLTSLYNYPYTPIAQIEGYDYYSLNMEEAVWNSLVAIMLSVDGGDSSVTKQITWNPNYSKTMSHYYDEIMGWNDDISLKFKAFVSFWFMCKLYPGASRGPVADWTLFKHILDSSSFQELLNRFGTTKSKSPLSNRIMTPILPSVVINPNIKFPSQSKASLITAAFAVAMVGVAVGVTAIALKKTRRNRVYKGMTKRSTQVDKAAAAYKQDPSGANLKRLSKANMKMQKSYDKAKKMGISSFNGKSIPSSTAISSGPVKEEVKNKAAEYVGQTMDAAWNTATAGSIINSGTDLQPNSLTDVLSQITLILNDTKLA